MNQTKNRQIANLVQSAKEQFGDFSDAKKREIFEIIKEAKSRGLLRKQPHDKCLSEYVNAANHLLRSYATEEFTASLNRNIDYIYSGSQINEVYRNPVLSSFPGQNSYLTFLRNAIRVRRTRQHQLHPHDRLTMAA